MGVRGFAGVTSELPCRYVWLASTTFCAIIATCFLQALCCLGPSVDVENIDDKENLHREVLL